MLTDSREGIRAGIPHNDNMLELLAELAADAMLYFKNIGEREGIKLIDDNIISVIPTDEELFSDPNDKSRVSFLPFYKAILNKFKSSELIPSPDGYVDSNNAYWAAVPQLPQLFSSEQLGLITENKNAQWAFTTLGRDEVNRNNKALFSYIDSLVKTSINEDAIISGRSRENYYNRTLNAFQSLESVKGITQEFIEAQPIHWLHKFYKWLSETKHRTDVARKKPIFLNQEGKVASAFDEKEQLVLFLPVKDVIGYNVVHPELLANPDTYKFVKQIGIKEPSLRDQIYNKILPLYDNGKVIDTDPHFMLFYKYYCECSNAEVEEFIGLIRKCKFLTYYKNGTEYRGSANSMYLPIPELLAYFETKPDTRFIALDKYKELVGLEGKKQLMEFLRALGIKDNICLLERTIDEYEAKKRNLPKPRSKNKYKWHEIYIDGLSEIIDFITSNRDKSKSILLWNNLLKVIEDNCSANRSSNLSSILYGACDYFYYSQKTEVFESRDGILLKGKKWLVSKEDNFVSADYIILEDLSDSYDTTSWAARELIDFLQIRTLAEEENDKNLSELQRKKIKLADRIIDLGFSEDDIAEYIKYRQRKNNTEQLSHQSDYASEELAEEIFDAEDMPELNNTTKSVVKDIISRTNKEYSLHNNSEESNNEDNVDMDYDELIPSAIDYNKKIENAKQKSAAEIDRIAYLEELQNKVLNSEKYTFIWFKSLLEMECINSKEFNSDSKEISISFGKVEKETGTKRTLVLRHPSRYIPQFIEDLTDIPLVLHIKDRTKTVAIEVASIKSYTLRVKLKNGADIDGIDLDSVTSATIDAKSPTFLLEELRKQFINLDYEDNFNMQKNLCKNIEFVFGPPGTGKTTHIAKNVLLPIMNNNKECKVLVLTPTNKSADVLVSRIMEVSGKDHSYENWLVRFGATGDENIEQSPVFRDKTFDIRKLSKNVTITTIARFPYDFFMPFGTRIFLNGINWDYIIIDEASMIPIANIVFPLYKKTPIKFIIAGDPFQIEPITSVGIWKNENIYTMVRLDSFTDPHTIPYQYKIELLTKQYRSIPAIGNIFSKFAYGGILKHHRNSLTQKVLNLGSDLNIKTLNIIKFPVSKYESVYRAKRLQHSSSYQIYSALFTFEYVSYISRTIAEKYKGRLYKIGIIAPYRAQADMIDKLLASEKLPKEVDVQVGTIHGFQGDECDIIFAVFNTPPTITASSEMFLNKRNIINVSISRARDYLFIIMPDDNTENISNLKLVKRVEGLIKETEEWSESLSPNLEKIMFGDSNYLEKNAFSTSHQSVNVYGLPEKRYEVRTEDTAVDVQIHKGISKPVSSDSLQNYITSYDHSDTIKEAAATVETDDDDIIHIPKMLREAAFKVNVSGKYKGTYYIVPLTGKLKDWNIKNVVSMFIPVTHLGKRRLMPVYVTKKAHIIYILRSHFNECNKEIINSQDLELVNSLH